MALFAISDLHLSLGTNKPMDIFSGNWEGYIEKIKKNWMETVGDKDTVIIPGDICWATYLNDTKEDFGFLHLLPGRKIISKGNHDYWWTTVTKMNKFLVDNNLNDIFFLHNNYYEYDEWAICGTRGWSTYENTSGNEEQKIFERERKRLELSLEQGKRSGKDNIVVVLHYPPFYDSNGEDNFMEIMKRFGVDICLYGHLHGDFSSARQGMINDIEFRLVSSDYLNFKPVKII